MVDPFNMYLKIFIEENASLSPYRNICYFVLLNHPVSFFHAAFLCRILNFNNVFDAYNRCLSYCFSCSVDKYAFTKPFGYIFQYRHPQDKEKQKEFKHVMSFRGTIVSTGQLYKLLAEKHKCRKYSN